MIRIHHSDMKAANPISCKKYIKMWFAQCIYCIATMSLYSTYRWWYVLFCFSLCYLLVIDRHYTTAKTYYTKSTYHGLDLAIGTCSYSAIGTAKSSYSTIWVSTFFKDKSRLYDKEIKRKTAHIDAVFLFLNR